jgi:hypothetical protein
MAEPHDAAALARASLRCASVAALTTYPRLAARPHFTTVAVTAGEDGSAVVLLRPEAPAAQHLLARPFATVTVAPAGCERVTLHGAVQRLAGKDQAGRLAFRLEAGAVRLGDSGIPVATTAYASANPNQFGRAASAVVAHVHHPHHAEQLTACLRAQGHDAQFAEAVALDHQGMTVVAVGLDGVTLVHLDFPAPITKLADLPPDLDVLLTCRCDGCARPTSSTDLPGGLPRREER